MAHYLNYPLARPSQLVGHDILIECEGVDAFINSYRNGMAGSVETAGAPLWRIIKKELPECKLVVVRRPLIEVYRSLTKKGFLPDLSELAELNATLDLLESVAQEIEYRNLIDPLTCRWLFEYCLEIDWDFDWWASLHQVNIQIDLKARMDQMERHKDRWKVLREEVAERSRGLEGWPLH